MSQTTAPQASRRRTVDPDARAPFGVGLLKGLGVTVKHLLKTPSTQMYPAVKPDLPPRTRGVIALMDENCTVCMLCARECPDWCIYIDSHKETVPPAKEGGRARTRNVLDRFAIDFSLCMYCGICVEVCPFDALWWSPEFEYTEYTITGLLHEMDKLREWADTVPPPPALDEGADAPAEVTDAITRRNNELDAAAAAAEQKALEEQQTREQAAAPAAKAPGPSRPRPTLADMEVEGEPQVDQEVFDSLVADGKSERMARSKAKAAWVKAEKQKLLDAAIAEWEAEQAATPAAAPAEGGGAAAPSRPKPQLADMEVEGEPQVDQEVFDQLIADGKTERMARSKAKAAWVKAEKQKLLDAAIAEWEAEQAAAPAAAPAEGGGAAAPSRPKPQLADMEVEGEPQVDQEVFDQLIADGKTERMARSKAKAAWVKAEKQKLLDAAIAEWEAEQASAAPAAGTAAADAAASTATPGGTAAADAAAPAEPAAPKLADVHVEGAGEIDQEVYDQLIAEGKSERMARSKAKAAWVRKRKQEQLDQGGDQ